MTDDLLDAWPAESFRVQWRWFYMHGAELHPAFTTDAEVSPENETVRILWPAVIPGTDLRCGTCSERISEDELPEMHCAAVPSYTCVQSLN